MSENEAFVVELPDGSGCFTAAMPLPNDHWLYKDSEEGNVPPMGLRIGNIVPGDSRYRQVLTGHVRNAVRYALRASTRNGRDKDFDPDSVVNNVIIGLFGYHTDSGLSGESFGDPEPIPSGLHSVLMALMAGRRDVPTLYMDAADNVGISEERSES